MKWIFNPLGANSDQHQISPQDIHALKRVQVKRIKEMISKD